jgi:hypothetical protein
VPESHRTEDLDDLVHWLGETIRQTDSSLLEEWEALTDPEAVAAAAARAAAGAPIAPARPVTGNERAFRVMVRNAMWRRVELAARDEWRTLAMLEASVAALTDPPREVVMGEQDWDDALAAYYDEHDEIELGPDARGPALLAIEREDRVWRVRQTLLDPAGDRDWVIEASADLDASDEVGEPVLLATAMHRL